MFGFLYFFITFCILTAGVISREAKSHHNRVYKANERFGVYLDARGMLRDVKTNLGPCKIGKDEFGLDAVLMNGKVVRRVGAAEKEREFEKLSKTYVKKYPTEIPVMEWGYVSKSLKNVVGGKVYRNLETGELLFKRGIYINNYLDEVFYYIELDSLKVVGLAKDYGDLNDEYIRKINDRFDEMKKWDVQNGFDYNIIPFLNDTEFGQTSKEIREKRKIALSNRALEIASEKLKEDIRKGM